MEDVMGGGTGGAGFRPYDASQQQVAASRGSKFLFGTVLASLATILAIGTEFNNEQYRREHSGDDLIFRKLKGNRMEITDNRYAGAPFCLSTCFNKNKTEVDTAIIFKEGDKLPEPENPYGTNPLMVRLLDNSHAVIGAKNIRSQVLDKVVSYRMTE